MNKIRLLLAEDHIMVRKGLRAILEEQADIEVVAEADDGREAVQLAKRLRPDIVLMDFSMPGLNGLEATRQITTRVPGTRVLVLTRHKNQEYVHQILQAGASGYLIKKSAPEELVTAVQALYRGDSYLDPAISQTIINGYLGKIKFEDTDLHDRLTPRQREVLQLIAEGHPNREIAEVLHISVKTVENHRANLVETLGVHSTAELTQFAIRMGIINAEDQDFLE